jgi:predicted cupin superfamily sugar epimerase
VVPATAWFGARVKGGKGHALVSCTVSPGFDFADFELATEEEFKAHPCYEQGKEFI